jgi:hypothetical protein
VSRIQNGNPIHVWIRGASSDGRAWTACGHVVEEDATTRDVLEVTCTAKGCVAEMKEIAERRLIGMRRRA